MVKKQCKNMLLLFHAKKDDISNTGQIKCICSAAFAQDVKLIQRVLRMYNI